LNQAKTTRTEAKRAEFDSKIDRILAAEDELIPTSGFLASVMERVQQEAAAPAPIPFPWKRLLPGVLMVAGVFGWVGYEFVRQGLSLFSLPASKSTIPIPLHLPAVLAASANQVEWVAMALGVSLLSWLLSRRLAGRGGLL
jgi:hypothetical protein